jgi:hypothetical protein
MRIAFAAHQIAALDQIDHLVVEHGIDRNILAAFKAKSINVHRADKGVPVKGRDLI